MKSIKILTACSLMMLSATSCDLTGINENPDKPTDDVNYNMNEPRLASTLRGGLIIEGNVEQRLKPLQIDLFPDDCRWWWMGYQELYSRR